MIHVFRGITVTRLIANLTVLIGSIIFGVFIFLPISAQASSAAPYITLHEALPITYTLYLPSIRDTTNLVLLSVKPDNSRLFDGQIIDNPTYPLISANGRYVVFTYWFGIPGVGWQGNMFIYDKWINQTTPVSVTADDSQKIWGSFASGISADGRYILFRHYYDNLVNDDKSSNWEDIFVHDRQTGQNTLVSVALDGGPSNDSVLGGSISANGRYAAFYTRAYNIVPNDTNGWFDIFVRDLHTHQTIRASIASDGQEANENSGEIALSPNGHYVAFQSWATNLVEGGTSPGNIFVHDLQTRQTSVASIAYDNTSANGASYNPSFSTDGRYIAFSSFASNLVENDTNNAFDIFIRDLQLGQTRRVSVSSNGDQANGDSSYPSLAANGRYIAFQSLASNLVENDTNDHDIFVHDLQTGQTYLISRTYDGTPVNGHTGHTNYPSISADGCSVAFDSSATNLVEVNISHPRNVFLADWVCRLKE